jgi:hypothetical protein
MIAQFERFELPIPVAVALDCSQGGKDATDDVDYALLSAIQELHAENADTPTICNDPAVRLIAHQLAWILRLSEFDRDLDAYGRALDTCREKSQ